MTVRTQDSNDVSLKYTLRLEDGTLLSSDIDGDRFDFTRGRVQIMPALEEALEDATKGEKRRFILSPVDDPDLKIDVSRLAQVLGHPGETLILEVEIL